MMWFLTTAMLPSRINRILSLRLPSTIISSPGPKNSDQWACFRSLQGINIHKMNIYTILCAKRNKLLAACCTCGFFAQGGFGAPSCKKSRLMGMLLEFVRYKYS
jgi:hypothetical protein